VITLIGAGHFLSHFFIFVLPPLLPLLKAEFHVGYTELGLAITAFNVASALAQTPAGFLVDRFGARTLLLAGILLGAVSYAGMGLLPSYLALVGFATLAGLANVVYHPADYASVSGERMGRAFSLHTFAGYAGGAAAPLAMALAVQLWDWKVGLMLTGALGFAVLALLLIGRGRLAEAPRAPAKERDAGPAAAEGGVSLLLSTPIVMCFVFFVLIAMSSGGINGFSVAAFVTLHHMGLNEAQFALTGFLVGNALGILAGGWIADRTHHHERVASLGFLATAVIIFLVGLGPLPGSLVIAAMAVGGLLFGLIMPSRDMLVRAVTPAGQTGKVFGFVTTGFNVGGMLVPALFGWLMDIGEARWLFVLAPIFMVLATATVFVTRAVQPGATGGVQAAAGD
jgi:MFS family permease